tara:strand:+ start:99 stop:593 length:495 start_codon:yes stop_codon:yes gene_type:complete
MSIRRVIKLMDRVREVAEMGGLDESDLKEFTNEFAVAIQDRLVDGLTGGYNIEGEQFKSLSSKTIANRRSQGIAGTKPLIATRELLNFVRDKERLMQIGKVQILLRKPPEGYMIAHNEERHNIPARKWYGIPKTYREGGTKYNEFLKKFVKRIEEHFAKALKFT